jgi:hypothetical protein
MTGAQANSRPTPVRISGVASLSASDSFFGTGNRVFGWIAAAVGVAYLIYYSLEGRREGPPPGNGGSPPIN